MYAVSLTLWKVEFLAQEMFEEIDKEADGEIYYREMVNHIRSLNRDMDQESNPQVGVLQRDGESHQIPQQVHGPGEQPSGMCITE